MNRPLVLTNGSLPIVVVMMMIMITMMPMPQPKPMKRLRQAPNAPLLCCGADHANHDFIIMSVDKLWNRRRKDETRRFMGFSSIQDLPL